MFHAGHNDVNIAKSLAASAEKLGADSVLVVSPCVFKPATVTELVAILSDIAAAAPKTPFWYYHYPGLYGVDFKISEVLAEATTGAHKVPTLAGIKFIDKDMKELSLAKAVANPWSADGQPFGIFVQSDFCLAAIPFGANGSPVITFQSPILHAIRGAYANATAGGSGPNVAAALARAADAQHRMHVLDNILDTNGGKAASRAIFKHLVGIDLGHARAPLTELDDGQAAALLKDLAAAGFDIKRFVPPSSSA